MTDREKAMQECEKFHLWLRDTVQNVHYANNNKMAKAYAKVYESAMTLTV